MGKTTHELKKLYYQYFASRDEYNKLQPMPETREAEKELNSFFEKYLLFGDDTAAPVYAPDKIRFEIEELINYYEGVCEMQGWVYGFSFAMQMMAACGVKVGGRYE